MDLNTFKGIVDSHPDEITPLKNDLLALYTHLGLGAGGSFSQRDASQELYRRISSAFTSGHQAAWRRCRGLREELIQREVIDGEIVDPYFAILDHMLDALRSQPQVPGQIRGDWSASIRHAYDNVRVHDWSPKEMRQRTHARAYEVAKAAKQLQIGGIRLVREQEKLYIEPDSETKLVGVLERMISAMGGINVCRRIFKQIAPLYDAVQERYHVVSRQNPTGGGAPQIPFGYLLLLAAKHFAGTRPIQNTDQNWTRLCGIATCYAAVLDVQEYAPTVWRAMDAVALVPTLRDIAIYDTLFRIPQIRGSDVPKIARGILRDFDFDQKYGSGWSLNDVLAVVQALLARFHRRYQGRPAVARHQRQSRHVGDEWFVRPLDL